MNGWPHLDLIRLLVGIVERCVTHVSREFGLAGLAFIKLVAYALPLKSLLETLLAQFVLLLHFLFSVKVRKFFIELVAFHDEKPLYLHVSPNYTVDDLEPLFFSEKAMLAHAFLH